MHSHSSPELEMMHIAVTSEDVHDEGDVTPEAMNDHEEDLYASYQASIHDRRKKLCRRVLCLALVTTVVLAIVYAVQQVPAAGGTEEEEGSCNVCGHGNQVTNADAIFTFPGQPIVPCSGLEEAGYQGMIPLTVCPFISGMIPQCDCQPIPAPIPAPTPTNWPVPAPATRALLHADE